MRTKIVSIFSALAAGGLIASPAADADMGGSEDFLYEVSAAGFNIDSDNQMAYLSLGLGICVELFSGNTVGGVTRMANSITSMTTADSMEFVGIAVNTLCPTAVASGVA